MIQKMKDSKGKLFGSAGQTVITALSSSDFNVANTDGDIITYGSKLYIEGETSSRDIYSYSSAASISTTLTNAINNSETGLVVASTSGMSVGQILIIGDEHIRVSVISADGTNLTCVRSVNGFCVDMR